MPYNKEDLIQYRLQRANTTAEEARSAIDGNFFFNAENRIYYSIFYSVSALALKFDYTTSKHKQLLGWFNQNFIKTGIIPLKYGKIYRNAYDKRQESDYDDFVTLVADEVQADFADMQEFVKYLSSFIYNEKTETE